MLRRVECQRTVAGPDKVGERLRDRLAFWHWYRCDPCKRWLQHGVGVRVQVFHYRGVYLGAERVVHNAIASQQAGGYPHLVVNPRLERGDALSLPGGALLGLQIADTLPCSGESLSALTIWQASDECAKSTMYRMSN